MQNPFPGIDPYVEAWHRWTDFSITFLCRFSERLLDQLSDGLDARIDWDEYWTTVEDTLPDGKKVLVKTEMRDRTIEVRQRSSRACFTKIVLLSEYQKSDTYDRYMLRNNLLASNCNLVELDLLIAGKRIPIEQSSGADHFRVLISHARQPRTWEVVSWKLNEELPTLQIPVSEDRSISVDLADVISTVYERGRYNKLIKYHERLNLPLSDDYHAWVRERIAEGLKTSA